MYYNKRGMQIAIFVQQNFQIFDRILLVVERIIKCAEKDVISIKREFTSKGLKKQRRIF